MTPWIRLWRDMPTDPKFRTIAKKAGRPLSDVLSVFLTMMTAADEDGTLDGWCADDCAAGLDLEPAHVAAIEAAMQGKVLDGTQLRGWAKRQPKRDDDSRARVQAFRERQKQPVTQCNADVTQRNATVTQGNAPDSDSEKKELKLTTSEQEAAREEVSDSKNGFELGGVGCGTALTVSVSVETKRRVASALGLFDASPLAERFATWQAKKPLHKRAREPDALFVATAAKLFKNAPQALQNACKPLSASEPAVPLRVARPSSQLIATLRPRGRHASH